MKPKAAAFCLTPLGALIFAALVVGGLTGLGPDSFNAQPAAAYTAEQVKTGPAGATTGTDKSGSTTAPDVAAGTGFTYQGRLKNGGSPASGQFDFTFSLFDAASGGNPVGIGVIHPNVTVQDGLFTVTLDFGSSAFNGEARWLQIGVRPADTGSYTNLSPRQPITPAPYALFALKTQGYDNVLVVAKSGGDFTSVQGALNSITDNSGANRYLVWVAPGTYSETVTMKQWVDIEGAGERQTTIIAPGSVTDTVATVIGANGAELRSLTVVNTGGAAYSIGIRNYSASPSLRNLTVTAGGGTTRNIGVYNHTFTSPKMAEMTIDVDGPDNSYNYGVYNHHYSSPTINDMTIYVSGWTNAHNRGVYNYNYSSPTMTDVHIEVSGGDGIGVTASSAAVENYLYSSPTIIDLTADVTGGETNAYAIGIYSYNSSLTMQGGIITCREATNNYGMWVSGVPGTTMDVDGLTISATGPVTSVNFAALVTTITLNATNSRFTAAGGMFARAMVADYNAVLNLNGAVLRASGASDSNIGLYVVGGSATVHGSDIAAEGQSGSRTGVYLEYQNLYLSNATLDNSKVKGATNTIRQEAGASSAARVAASKLEGGPVLTNGVGAVSCAGVHDENYAFFTNTCP